MATYLVETREVSVAGIRAAAEQVIDGKVLYTNNAGFFNPAFYLPHNKYILPQPYGTIKIINPETKQAIKWNHGCNFL